VLPAKGCACCTPNDGNAHGTRLTQMNQEVANNLEKIITTLENDHPQEVADAS
jgi:hypothetical protein